MPAVLNLKTEGRQVAELLDERVNIVAAVEALTAEAEAEGESGWNDDRSKKFDELQAAYDEFTAKIVAIQKVEGRREFAKTARQSLNDPLDRKVQPDGGKRRAGEYACFGETLIDIAHLGRTNEVRPRLVNYMRTVHVGALGMNEGVPSEGGVFVGEDTENELMTKAYNQGLLLGRVQRTPISAASDRLKIRRIDETSRADGSRSGGVAAAWENEGDDTSVTKPKFVKDELALEKLIAITYATEELLQDATALQSEMNTAFLDEIVFKVEDAIVNGVGGFQPVGILNSGCKITVSYETGQTSATSLLYENIVKMWARMHPRSHSNAVWLVDQSLIPALFLMALTNGTSGTPVYLPPNGAADAPFGTIFGRPVLHTEYTKAANTEGDIILFDPTQYRVIEKGGINAQSSVHVAFLTGETAFRWVYRVNGAPKWKAAVTPKNASSTMSPIITLQTRV